MMILQHVYQRCGDNTETFVANCKNLRPVQIKEINESLGKLEKSVRAAHQAQLFSGNHHGDDGGDISASGKEAKEIEAGQRHGNAAASAFEAPQRDTNQSAG